LVVSFAANLNGRRLKLKDNYQVSVGACETIGFDAGSIELPGGPLCG